MEGGEGPDTISSFGGRDVLHGGPGSDRVNAWGTLPVQGVRRRGPRRPPGHGGRRGRLRRGRWAG
ncbi:hypothetical protein LP418_17360 [Nocardioides sp. B-3]|nr:hypothetical protein LP418_17360 [Nocardioides sp. B-3]